MPEIKTPIDHNFHLLNEKVVQEWEERRTPAYKTYRKDWSQFPIEHTVGDFPLHLDIEATSACNFACTMCARTDYIANGTMWKIENFNFEKYKQIIDDGVKNGLRSVKFQYIGEPLINKKLPEMIKYAKDAGVCDVMFNTNASLLTEKKAVEIIESGLDKLFFSFDSPYREEFNKIRVKGDYDQVLNNIKNFMRIKREMKSDTPLTRVQMVTMKENEKDFDEFVKLFKPVVDTIAHIDYLDHDIQLDQDNDKTIVDLKTDQKVKFCCPQLWQRMFVHPDGVVTPCCIDSGRKMVMGNIHKSSLKDIWKNEKYQEMRKLHKEGNMNQIPTCSRCPLAKY
ncbi:radical SAM protein [Candidatus Pelagibacter sp.]|jgi:radical SAM protein with 4Fe4S-binding SPASM domain|nr:radical SAM protein [Candidatus Pelagibacter sp.]